MQTDIFEIFRIKDNINLSQVFYPIETCWESPSNIALIKYWGKKDGQLPANPSLSMTLSKAVTLTSVKALPSEGKSGICMINGDHNHLFIPKLQKLYNFLASEIPLLNLIKLEVRTENSFPHSTGIASSASGISAFTLCILEIALKLKISNNELPDSFFNIASYASRIGSGSACRSVFKGFTVWGKTEEITESSDYKAIAINDQIHPEFTELQDAILIVSSEPKAITSSLGHNLMNNHPYAESRFKQANNNLRAILTSLKSGDFNKLAFNAENEALSLHALLMTSDESGLLIKSSTLEIITQIRKARNQGLPVFFTLDAGPNIHLFYQKKYAVEVEQFIKQKLLLYCEDGKHIFDYYGNGPIQKKWDSSKTFNN